MALSACLLSQTEQDATTFNKNTFQRLADTVEYGTTSTHQSGISNKLASFQADDNGVSGASVSAGRDSDSQLKAKDTGTRLKGSQKKTVKTSKTHESGKSQKKSSKKKQKNLIENAKEAVAAPAPAPTEGNANTPELVPLKDRNYIARLCDKIVALRVQEVDSQRQRCRQQRARALEAQAAFLKMTDSVLKGTPGSTLASMKSLHDAAVQANDDVNHEEEIAQHLENKLSALEFELESFLSRISQNATPGLASIEPANSILRQFSDENDQPTGVRELHPLLRSYYNKVGDIDVILDRLDDLNMEHLEHTEIREIPYWDFIDNYNREQGLVLKELFQAQRDARQLRIQCVEQGLNPDTSEEDKRAKSLAALRSDEPEMISTSSRQEYLAYITDPKPYDSRRLKDNLDPGFVNLRQRFRMWLIDLRKNQGVPPESDSISDSYSDLGDEPSKRGSFMSAQSMTDSRPFFPPDPWEGEMIKRRWSQSPLNRKVREDLYTGGRSYDSNP